MRHPKNTNKTDLARLREVSLHNLKHLKSTRLSEWQNATEVGQLKWTVTILIGFALFVWNSPALDSDPYHSAWSSPHLYTEERFLEVLAFPLTLVIILSNLLFVWLSLLIYVVNK